MGTIIGVPLSAVKTTGNTGIAKRDIKLHKMVGIFLAQKGFKIPAAECTNFNDVVAYLQEKTIAANPNERLYPINEILGYTETTEAPTVVKSALGMQKGYNENPQTFDLDIRYNGIGHYKSIRQWLFANDAVAYILDSNAILGKFDKKTGDFLPYDVAFTPKQVKYGNGKDTATETMVELQIKDATALSDKAEGITFEADEFTAANELFGCLDLAVEKVNSTTVKVFQKVSRTDMYDQYSTALAVIGAWKITDAVTGNEVTSGVTVATAPASKGWAFTGLTGVVDISLVDPTALAALNIGSSTAGGFECEEVARLGE